MDLQNYIIQCLSWFHFCISITSLNHVITFLQQCKQTLENYFTKLLKLIHDELGEFFINDFSPHYITSKFPLRLHADTGKDPDDIIGQNILIPINIFPKDKIAHTIIFKNR